MNPGEIRIRVATAHDVQLLAELGDRTFRDTFGEDNTEADMASYLASSFSLQRVSAELNDAASTFLIAEVDGTDDDAPIGYARLRSGAAPRGVVADSPIEIVRFYTERRWIGRGVGTALMEACLAKATADQHDVVWLDVWERNLRAIAFYSKWGFAIVGEQEFVLGEDVQHDLLMARHADSRGCS